MRCRPSSMSMSRMRTRAPSEQSPQALNRSRDLLTCLTATDERRFEIRGGTSGRSRHTAGADVRGSIPDVASLIRATFTAPLRADLELPIELTTLLRFDSNRRPAWLPAL